MTLISRLRISLNLSPEYRSSHRLLCHDLRGAEHHGNEIWFLSIWIKNTWGLHFLCHWKTGKTTMIEDRISLVILNSSKLTVGEKNQSCHRLLKNCCEWKMLSLRVKGVPLSVRTITSFLSEKSRTPLLCSTEQMAQFMVRNQSFTPGVQWSLH